MWCLDSCKKDCLFIIQLRMQEENGRWACFFFFLFFKGFINSIWNRKTYCGYYILRLKYATRTYRNIYRDKWTYRNIYNSPCLSNSANINRSFLRRNTKREMGNKSFSASQDVFVLMPVKIWGWRMQVFAISHLNRQVPSKPFSLVTISSSYRDSKRVYIHVS